MPGCTGRLSLYTLVTIIHITWTIWAQDIQCYTLHYIIFYHYLFISTELYLFMMVTWRQSTTNAYIGNQLYSYTNNDYRHVHMLVNNSIVWLHFDAKQFSVIPHALHASLFGMFKKWPGVHFIKVKRQTFMKWTPGLVFIPLADSLMILSTFIQFISH